MQQWLTVILAALGFAGCVGRAWALANFDAAATMVPGEKPGTGPAFTPRNSRRRVTYSPHRSTP